MADLVIPMFNVSDMCSVLTAETVSSKDQTDPRLKRPRDMNRNDHLKLHLIHRTVSSEMQELNRVALCRSRQLIFSAKKYRKIRYSLILSLSEFKSC